MLSFFENQNHLIDPTFLIRGGSRKRIKEKKIIHCFKFLKIKINPYKFKFEFEFLKYKK